MTCCFLPLPHPMLFVLVGTNHGGGGGGSGSGGSGEVERTGVVSLRRRPVWRRRLSDILWLDG
jgi:hypothetical protein